jgi:hypothetical protein
MVPLFLKPPRREKKKYKNHTQPCVSVRNPDDNHDPARSSDRNLGGMPPDTRCATNTTLTHTQVRATRRVVLIFFGQSCPLFLFVRRRVSGKLTHLLPHDEAVVAADEHVLLAAHEDAPRLQPGRVVHSRHDLRHLLGEHLQARGGGRACESRDQERGRGAKARGDFFLKSKKQKTFGEALGLEAL